MGRVSSYIVRPAINADLPEMARMAGELVRIHYAFDPRRFMLPDDVERGYQRWFARELRSAQVVAMTLVLMLVTFIGIVVPMLVTRPMLACAITAGLVAVVARELPYNLGLMAGALAGIVIGYTLESMQPSPATSRDSTTHPEVPAVPEMENAEPERIPE